jgi:hypothetical protein
MRVNTQENLQPQSVNAHSVVVYDRANNPIFAATHFLGESDIIIAARAGEEDFQAVLNLIGADVEPKVKIVSEVHPKNA